MNKKILNPILILVGIIIFILSARYTCLGCTGTRGAISSFLTYFSMAGVALFIFGFINYSRWNWITKVVISIIGGFIGYYLLVLAGGSVSV